MTPPDSGRAQSGGASEAGASGTGERVGLVLSGAAARGPYQAGALAELLPTLVAQGHRPVVLLGTSSGAITAALFAQFADQPPVETGRQVVHTWVEFGDVYKNPLYTPKPVLPMLARLAFGGLADPVDALLDTAPLREHAKEVFKPERVAANIHNKRVHSLAVAATVCPPARSAARSRLFVQGAQPGATPLQGHAVDVVEATLTVDHLLASAAIPVLFPPVYIDSPDCARGYYVDGGVRLNAPFKAALAMGVDRLVVISGHSVDPRPVAPTAPGNPPDLAASTAVALRAVLADALSDDLQTLRRKNEIALGPGGERLPYRVVRHLLVAPEDGKIAELAASTFRPSGPADPYWAIGRLLDAFGSGSGRNELLSLILFHRAYAQQQADLGREHARGAIAAGWQT
jgi:NTE family protein